MKGFYRIAAGVPAVKIASPAENFSEILKLYREACEAKAAVLVLPELSLTGYTCGDLFDQRMLLAAAERKLAKLRNATEGHETILIVGLPLLVGGRLYSAAAVLQDAHILGVTGKTYLANYRGNYELRNFRSIREANDQTITLCGDAVPFGPGLIFHAGENFSFGIEFGEDLLSPKPPSTDLVLGGATVIFNLAADPEIAGRAAFRRRTVGTHSERCKCIYAYVSAGASESTTDQVYSGHAMIYEDGQLLAENQRLDAASNLIFAEVNPNWMEHQRRVNSSFNEATPDKPLRRITASSVEECDLTTRKLSPTPFVPEDQAALVELCQETFNIQVAALAKRITHTHANAAVIGISGGLDSTLALLVCAQCCDRLGLPRTFIKAITMPGMGTTGRTYKNACQMAREVGAELREISIAAAVKQHFADIGHDPENLNVVYENSQARERTQILMDLANEYGGLVIGTGDLSEIALGWSTYNGDHMSMYAVNCDIPKTLIRPMVEHYAVTAASPTLAACLRDVNETPVSPELLPGGTQQTEGILGSYTIHDFFLYYFLRYGSTPAELLELAENAFGDSVSHDEIAKAWETFARRFFTQQFKRNCAPDGPKVGAVALSTRADWKMPSDAVWTTWENAYAYDY